MKGDEIRTHGMTGVGGLPVRMESGGISQAATRCPRIEFRGQVFRETGLIRCPSLLGRETERLSDPGFEKSVASLSKGMIDKLALPVEKIVCRPVMVMEASPEALILVEEYGKAKAIEFDGFLNASGGSSKGKLGRVDGNDNQPSGAVFPVKMVEVGKGPDAVDAGIVPEIEEDDLSGEIGGRDGTLFSEPASISVKQRGRCPGYSRQGLQEEEEKKDCPIPGQSPKSLSHQEDPLNFPRGMEERHGPGDKRY